MGLYASWTQGNALTVESPENLTRVGHFGWGADMLIAPGKKSWFHISLPTPVLVNSVQSTLVRAFLLFEATSGSIRNVHIYHGGRIAQEFNNLLLTGSHHGGVDATNTFTLAAPPRAALGIGISFLFQADAFTGGPVGGMVPPRLIVTSAGGDFTV